MVAGGHRIIAGDGLNLVVLLSTGPTVDASFMMVRPGFVRWNSRVGFLTFLAVDAVCGGSRELSITFFSY